MSLTGWLQWGHLPTARMAIAGTGTAGTAAVVPSAPGRDPDALSGQVPVSPERVVSEFPELRGHRPAAQLCVGHRRRAVADPGGNLDLSQPGRVPVARQQAPRFGPGG